MSSVETAFARRPTTHETNVPSARMSTTVDVAIIGMACRFPDAATYGEFWENLAAGRDCVREIPPARWDVALHYSPDINDAERTMSRWCGLVEPIDRFDHRFFGISPREARSMDPQQRLLLEETLHCIEDSGVPSSELRERKTAVFVGAMSVDYQQETLHPSVRTDSFSATGNYVCILANRVSYAFGLRGKSFAIDAACASSLVALHEARRSLQSGESDYALVAGVNLNFHPWKYVSWSKSRMLSPDGRCKTFDKDANGYVPGDGIGVLLLQRADEALRDRNRIYALVRGSAVGHGGAANSMTAPRVEAQEDVIVSALEDAGISAETIGYVEAHGTGTSLGDPIEVEALTSAYRRYTANRQFAGIGSVKTNIGHLEAAAGVAGVIKAVLMIRHGTVPQTLHVRTLNPLIEFRETPFEVALQARPWPRPESHPRRAGVSSFGIGGVNSHVILEEHIVDATRSAAEASEPTLPARAQAFVLSAASSTSFRKRVAQFRGLCDRELEGVRLEDLCKTLAVASSNHDVRRGALVSNLDDLRVFLDRSEAEIERAPEVLPVSVVLGPCALRGFSAVRPLYERHASFSKRLDAGLRELMHRTETQGLEAELQWHEWRAKTVPAFSCLVVEAFWGCIGDVGFRPARVCGRQQGGFWLAAALSGTLSPADAAAAAAWGLPRAHLAPSQPRSELFDPLNRRWIAPLRVTPEYLEGLVRDVEPSPSDFSASMSRAHALFESQHTFKRFIEEWNETFAALGVELRRLLVDGASAAERVPVSLRTLLFVAVESAFGRLREKWKLTPPRGKRDERLVELVQLVVDGVLPPRALRALFASRAPDAASVAALVNVDAARGFPAERYPLLAAWPREKLDLDWLQAAATADTAATFDAETGVYEWGLPSPDGDLARLFDQTLIELWQRGANIRWDVLYPQGTYDKVALPAYPFDGEVFWVRTRSRDAAEGVTTLRQAISLEDAIVRDHVIAGRHVLPGALLIQAAFSALESSGRESPALGNVVFHTPGLVSGVTELIVEVIGSRVRIALAGAELCHAELAERAPSLRPQEHPRPDGHVFDAAEIYRRLGDQGFAYGPSLRLLDDFAADGEGSCSVVRVEPLAGLSNTLAHVVDAALQGGLLMANLRTTTRTHGRLLPAAVGHVWVSADITQAALDLVIRPTALGTGQRGFAVDVTGHDANGGCRLELRNVVYRRAESDRLAATPVTRSSSWLAKSLHWTRARLPSGELHSDECRVGVVGADSAPDGWLAAIQAAYPGRVEACSLDGDFTLLLERLTTAPGRALVYFLPALAQPAALADATFDAGALRGLFSLAKAHARHTSDAGFRIIVPTSQAFVVTESDFGQCFPSAALLGLARTAMLESPKLEIRLVDLQSADPLELASVLREASYMGQDDAVVAYRDGVRFVQELRDLTQAENDGAPLFEDGKSYLISGGAGGVGRALIDELASTVSCRLFLLGRSAPHGDDWQVERSEGRRCEVRFVRCDVTEVAEVERVVAEIAARFGPLHGVLQLAGSTHDKLLLSKSWEEFRSVLAPKIDGTLNLERCTRDQPLAFFIAFSSIVSLIGNRGQADYAAANSFLDAFIAFRGRADSPGRSLSFNWPLWEDVGMGARLAQHRVHPEGESTFRDRDQGERRIRASHARAFREARVRHAGFRPAARSRQTSFAVRGAAPGRGDVCEHQWIVGGVTNGPHGGGDAPVIQRKRG